MLLLSTEQPGHKQHLCPPPAGGTPPQTRSCAFTHSGCCGQRGERDTWSTSTSTCHGPRQLAQVCEHHDRDHPAPAGTLGRTAVPVLVPCSQPLALSPPSASLSAEASTPSLTLSSRCQKTTPTSSIRGWVRMGSHPAASLPCRVWTAAGVVECEF